jgi:predicted transcriptional regulator
MSYEKILNVFALLGISYEDVRMYLNLAVNGPQTLQVLQGYLQSGWSQVLISTRRLEEKGLTRCVKGKFKVIPFEEVLEIIIASDLNDALTVEKNKEKIIEQWQTCLRKKINKIKKTENKLRKDGEHFRGGD